MLGAGDLSAFEGIVGEVEKVCHLEPSLMLILPTIKTLPLAGAVPGRHRGLRHRPLTGRGELIAPGHEVKLMPPACVKAYVKRNKNDAADAEAICEAVTRPSMRFVPVTDAEQQSILMLHRVRSLLIRQRTMLVNALRAHMAA
jgi:transposase